LGCLIYYSLQCRFQDKQHLFLVQAPVDFEAPPSYVNGSSLSVKVKLHNFMSFSQGQKRGYVQVTGRVGLLFRTTRQTEEETRSAKESMNEMKRRRVESAEYLVEEQSEEVSNENEVEADEYRVSEEDEEELSRENEVEEIEVIVSNETLETEEADEVEENLIKESETEQLFRLAKKLNYTLRRTPTKSTKRTSTTPLTHQTPSSHQRKSARNSITRHYPNEVNQYTQSVDRDEKEAQRVKAVRRPLTDSECESADDVCQIRFTGVPKVYVCLFYLFVFYYL
jgi:hypothetical protein